MIVLTKGKILTFLSLFIVAIICCLILYYLSKPAYKEAFSGYENILNRQIFPQEDTVEKDFSGKRILKHIFKFSDAPSPTPSPTPKASEPIPEPLIQSESITIDKAMEIKNATNYQINLNDYIKKDLSFKGKANILIMHTHTTESFAQMQYTKDAPDRNLDENCNMIAVGKAMNEVFQKNGIKVTHDTTVHDYPSYNSSYQKACGTIEKNLKNDNTINIVLDIHRDGITREDGTKVKLVKDIDGTKTAQIMLVVGTNTNLTHDNWQDNLAFATQIQNAACKLYPGLMRPIDLRKERFNQQLTKGSLIIEVGANGNTLEEAIAGGKAIAEVISTVVK